MHVPRSPRDGRGHRCCPHQDGRWEPEHREWLRLSPHGAGLKGGVAVRSRALAMVKALRQATASIGSEHASAHAVLDGHFRMLETSVQWEDILGAAP